MKNRLVVVVVAFVLSIQGAQAFSGFKDSPLLSEKPRWFQAGSLGGFYGETEQGTYFSQRPVANAASIRLHKFTIADVYFYVSDKGVIYAESDLEALSVYFTLA